MTPYDVYTDMGVIPTSHTVRSGAAARTRKPTSLPRRAEKSGKPKGKERRETPERVPVRRRVPGGSGASGPRRSLEARAPNW